MPLQNVKDRYSVFNKMSKFLDVSFLDNGKN